ncbi:MAG: hypothetical protein JWR22_2217 [Herminiimonas sp.]|nr:hypothetical protein [Herminiimonas sp.]
MDGAPTQNPRAMQRSFFITLLCYSPLWKNAMGTIDLHQNWANDKGMQDWPRRLVLRRTMDDRLTATLASMQGVRRKRTTKAMRGKHHPF